MPYMITRRGKRFDLETFTAEDFTIEDIAFALAGERRYASNSPIRFSVAQHSIIVSRLVPASIALPALLHDANEMITGDIPKPVKRLIDSDKLTALVQRIDAAVAARFGFDPKLFEDLSLKLADRKAWRWEMANIHPEELETDPRLKAVDWSLSDDARLEAMPLAMSETAAELSFLMRFYELTSAANRLAVAPARE